MAEEKKAQMSRREFLKGLGAAALLAATPHSLVPKPQEIEVVTPGNHRLKVFFHFGKHDTEERAEREVIPLIRKVKPHVVGFEPEIGANDENTLREVEDNCDGQHSPYQHRIMRHAYSHKIKLYGLERYTPAESQATEERCIALDEKLYAATTELSRGNIRGALNNYEDYMNRWTEFDLKRESEINRRLSNLYAGLVDRYPELKKEREIRVVIPYGTAHTPIYLGGKKAGFGTIQRSVSTPTYFGLASAYSRRERFGLPTRKLTEHEVARALLAELIDTDFLRTINNVENRSAFTTIVTKGLTLAQIKKILEAYGSSQRFGTVLRAEGINPPSTREELRRFLVRRLGEKRVTQE